MTWYKHCFAYLVYIRYSVFSCDISLIELTFLSQISTFSRILGSSLEVQKAKRNLSVNLGHYILKLYSVLVQVQYATIKTKLDI